MSGVPSPPGAAAHAAGPLRGRCGLFLSSSLRSPFLPRVTGGKRKKMWVRASAAPPSATDRQRARGMGCAGGGRARSLSRSLGPGAVPRPQGRVGGVLRGRWLMGPRAPAAPPRCPVLEMALRTEGKCQPRCQSLPVASFHPSSPLPLPERLWLDKVAPGAR